MTFQIGFRIRTADAISRISRKLGISSIRSGIESSFSLLTVRRRPSSFEGGLGG